MSMGTIESAVYVNQQMATVASERNVQLNRYELQNLAAAVIVNEKEKEIQEVRPTEETGETNKDAEHKKREEELKKRTKESKKKEDKEEDIQSEHKLNVKV